MSVAPPWPDKASSSPSVASGAGLPRAGPTLLIPLGEHAELGLALVLVGLLLLVLLFLLVRCVRILLDPYSSMPAGATAWTGHKEAPLERGQFDFALA